MTAMIGATIIEAITMWLYSIDPFVCIDACNLHADRYVYIFLRLRFTYMSKLYMIKLYYMVIQAIFIWVLM